MAGLDSSIYSQLQPVQQINPLAQMAQVAQLQHFQRTANKEDRAAEQQNRLLGLVGSADFASLPTAQKAARLQSIGAFDQAGKLAESDAKSTRDTREGQKFELESRLKIFDKAAGIAGAVTDQTSYDRALPMMQSLGFDTSKWSPQYNPQGVAQFAASTLEAKERLAADMQRQQFGETQRHNLTTEGLTATGQQMTNQRAVDANAISSTGKNRDAEMKLSDDYRAQSKDFKAVSDAYRTINTTLDQATTSPAATLAGATKFMKLLDPGSVVRESELGMALQASGVIDRATNYINVLQSGKVLTPTQVKDFKDITNQIYTAAKEGQAAVDADYTAKAEQYGLNPRNIVQDLGPKAAPPKGAAADKPAQTKVIGGRTYANDGKGWYAVN